MDTIEKMQEDLEIIKMQSFLRKRALTLEEVCQYTGMKKSYLYKLTMLNKIPGVSKPNGKKIFIDREKLDNWLLGSPMMTADEIEAKAATYISSSK